MFLAMLGVHFYEMTMMRMMQNKKSFSNWHFVISYFKELLE